MARLYAIRLPVVAASYAAAALSTLRVFDEYSWAQYAYLGVIALGLITWYQEYHLRAQRVNEKLRKGFTIHPEMPPTQAPPMRAAPVLRQPVTTSTMSPPPRARSIFDDFEKI